MVLPLKSEKWWKDVWFKEQTIAINWELNCKIVDSNSKIVDLTSPGEGISPMNMGIYPWSTGDFTMIHPWDCQKNICSTEAHPGPKATILLEEKNWPVVDSCRVGPVWWLDPVQRSTRRLHWFWTSEAVSSVGGMKCVAPDHWTNMDQLSA